MMVAIGVVALLSMGSSAQGEAKLSTDGRSAVGSSSSPAAAVVFTFENRQRDIPKYTLSIDRLGNGWHAEHQPAADSGAAGEQSEFRVSPATRDKVFELARAARYFEGSFEYTKRRLAYTGDRSFTYQDPERQRSTRFKNSTDPAILELTRIFEGIHNALAAEAKLQYLYRHEKLGLNAYLASLEREVKNAWVQEVQLAADVLRQIAHDRSVMEIARERAQRLLAQAEDGSQNATKPHK